MVLPDRPVTLTTGEIAELKQKLSAMNRDIGRNLSLIMAELEQVLPEKPVTLTAEEIAELNRQLSTMRHDINNNLSLVMAGVELVRLKPESFHRMMDTLSEQPAKISGTMAKFSVEFEQVFGIKR